MSRTIGTRQFDPRITHSENDTEDLLLFPEDDKNDRRRETSRTVSTSFALSSKINDVEDDLSVLLPTPKRQSSSQHSSSMHTAAPLERTPLFPTTKRRNRQRVVSPRTTNVLFGPTVLEDSRQFRNESSSHGEDRSHCCFQNAHNSNHNQNERPTGLAGFFFGFMYEEKLEDFEEDDEHNHEDVRRPVWNNHFNRVLCLAHACMIAAAAVPVTLIPYLHNGVEQDLSVFSSRAAAFAVLGTACGKFANGPLGDVCGAKRVSCIYSVLLALSLSALTLCWTSRAIWACLFFVEFFTSVQWPCIIVMLASHYHNDASLYDGGVYFASMASRFGAVLAIPLSSYLLQSIHWITVAQASAFLALLGCAMMYLWVPDDDAMDYHTYNKEAKTRRPTKYMPSYFSLRTCFLEKLLPSISQVFASGTFWIVAIAHAGGCMVRSSGRVLGTYLADTSLTKSGSFPVVLDVGILLGLAIGGRAFSSCECWFQKKRLVGRLYLMTIASCYALALLAIPAVHKFFNSTLLLVFQLVAIVCAGVGVAVQLVHIPSIVGVTTFASCKGLYSSFTDGVANGLASFFWRVVGNAVQQPQLQSQTSSTGVGWAYGWAAVALLVIMSSVLMVEFIYHYFCRHRGGPRRSDGDGYETIIFV